MNLRKMMKMMTLNLNLNLILILILRMKMILQLLARLQVLLQVLLQELMQDLMQDLMMMMMLLMMMNDDMIRTTFLRLQFECTRRRRSGIVLCSSRLALNFCFGFWNITSVNRLVLNFQLGISIVGISKDKTWNVGDGSPKRGERFTSPLAENIKLRLGSLDDLLQFTGVHLLSTKRRNVKE